MNKQIRDIVVLGGSAGSIEVIREVVRSFPPHMPAAVFIVIHFFHRQQSFLPSIVGKNTDLITTEVTDGAQIEPGHIYVATPDKHLMFAGDRIHLGRGPKEGLQRPSINVTFRSAASVFGPRVIGIVVSGLLDDGAAGLWEVARHGGVTMVQDPQEAVFPSMPVNASQDTDIDYKLRAAEIGPVVGRIVNGDLEPPRRTTEAKPPVEEFSGFTCPECRGPLYVRKQPGPVEFRCRVGHVLSLETLVDEATSMQERKLYEAIVALEEGSDLAAFSAAKAQEGDREGFLKESTQLREFAASIREMIERRDVPKLP